MMRRLLQRAARPRGSRAALRFAALALACASCESEPTAAAAPASPPAADLRFKGAGSPQTALRVTANLVWGDVLVENNGVGTPLQTSPCAPPGPVGANCSWSFAVFGPPDGPDDVNTVYYGIGSLPKLDTDLGLLQRWMLALSLPSPLDLNSVVTSLQIDVPGHAYATSGIQTKLMRDFDLVWGSVSTTALQAAASQVGAQGRVITAVAYDAGAVVYLAYGWVHASSTVYEAKVVTTPFASVTAAAQALASQGYFITAVGGNVGEGYVLVGTRVRGETAPRSLAIATDSIASLPRDNPVQALARDGYAVMGGIFDAPSGASRMFNLYIGEK
jgi:hypothetical protein